MALQSASRIRAADARPKDVPALASIFDRQCDDIVAKLNALIQSFNSSAQASSSSGTQYVNTTALTVPNFQSGNPTQYNCNPPSAMTVQLPDGTRNSGVSFTFVNLSTFAITINAAAGQFINGAASVKLSTQYDAAVLKCGNAKAQGDFNWTSGSVNLDTGVTAATYGDATHVAQIALGPDGRARSAANVAITFPAASATGMGYQVGPGPGGTVRNVNEWMGVRFQGDVSGMGGVATGVYTVGNASTETQDSGGGGGFVTGYTGDTARPMFELNSGAGLGYALSLVQPHNDSNPPLLTWLPMLQGSIRPITAFNARLWFGWLGSDLLSDARNMRLIDSSSTIPYLLFRFSTNAGDTAFQAAIGTGASHSETSTTVPYTAGATMQYCIDCTNFPTSIDFWLNGVKTNIAVGLPAASAGPWCGYWCVKDLSNSATNSIAFGNWSWFRTV